MADCSECGRLCSDLDSYKNTKTGKIWCLSCFTKEKKKRMLVYFKRG